MRAIRRMTSRTGHSLIEIVLVLGIIAVLVALSVPSLSSLRHRAEMTFTLAQLRSHAQVLSAYTGDWDGAWPVFINPTIDPTWIQSGNFGAELFYFDSCFSWNIALADGYYGAEPIDPAFFPPNYEDPAVEQFNFFTPLLYSCSMIADPEYWEYETRLEDMSQWNGTRVDQVRYPSAKCLLVDSWRRPDWSGTERASERLRMSLVDGSAVELPSASVNSGYRRGDGVTHGGHPTGPPRGLHTIGGILGHDIDRSP